MKITLEDRKIEPGLYYITVKEALRLCKEADPEHKLADLPKKGFERKVKLDGQVYWLGRVDVDGREVWTIESS